MASTIASLLACSAAVVSIAAAEPFAVHKETTAHKTLRFSGSGVPTIDVRANSGAVHVSNYQGRDVEIDARTVIAAADAAAATEAERDVTLDTKEDGSTIEAVVRDNGTAACGESSSNRSRAWWDRRRYEVSVDLTVRVPAGTRVRLCTVNSRDVLVDGTSGDFDISNVNGAITLANVRGSGRVSTVNGRVDVSFAEAPRAESLFKAVNGEIAVTLPANTSANLRLKTQHGGLFTDFDVVPEPIQPTASKDSRNGKYVYRFNGYTAVRIGRGGPELTFETVNGDVRVRRARK
jgi:hypothetical protein